MNLAVGILLFGWQASPSPMFNYLSWTPHSPQLWKMEYTHTHTELCKCMCHVLAVIFLGLCFAKGYWQLQYRVQYTSERLLLEMKAKVFYFSQQFARHFLWYFRPALSLSQFPFVCCFSLYLRFLTLDIIRTHTYLSSLLYICLTFISQSSILPIKQSISFCFSCISGELISHSSIFPLHSISHPFSAHFSFICFSSATHSSPYTHHLPLCVAWWPSPSKPPSHMLFFSLCAVTVSLAGLGNSVWCALLSHGELFSQQDMRVHSYVNWNYKLQNTVCSKEKVRAQQCTLIRNEKWVWFAYRLSFLEENQHTAEI